MSGSLDSNPMTLENLLNSKLTLCRQCGDPLREAHLLPCLHNYCKVCLLRRTQETVKAKDGNGTATDGREAMSKSEGEACAFSCAACDHTDEYGLEEVNPNVCFDNLLKIKRLQNMSRSNFCDYCSFEKKANRQELLKELPTPIVEQACLTCCDALCQSCADAHKKTKLTRDHEIVSIDEIQRHTNMAKVRRGQEAWCSEHAPTPLIFCCTGCNAPACAFCLSSAAHKLCSGKREEAGKRAQHIRWQLQNVNSGIEDSVTAYSNYLDMCRGKQREASCKTGQTRDQIKKRAHTLHGMVDEYARLLNIKLDKIESDTQANHKVQRDEVTGYIKRSQHTREMMTTLQQHAKDSELNAMHKMLELSFDKVSGEEMPAAKEITMDRSKLAPELSNSLSTLDIRSAIERCFGELAQVALLLTDLDKEVLDGLPETAVRAGSSIPLLNRPVLLRQLECRASDDDKTLWPSGVAVNGLGHLVICDRENQKIKIFSSEGELLHQITGYNTDYRLVNPFDVATTRDNRIIVTDYGRECALVFTGDGEGAATLRGPFKYPRGVAVWYSEAREEEEILVLDSELGHVTIHDGATYQLKSVIKGQTEGGRKMLTDPYYITVSPARRRKNSELFLITDLAAPHVHVLDRQGNHRAFQSDYGLVPGRMLHPYGICVDRHGYTLIADNENNRVLAFNTNGQFERVLIGRENLQESDDQRLEAPPSRGMGTAQREGSHHKGPLWHPMTLALTKEGHLIVAEGLGKVKVFQYYD